MDTYTQNDLLADGNLLTVFAEAEDGDVDDISDSAPAAFEAAGEDSTYSDADGTASDDDPSKESNESSDPEDGEDSLDSNVAVAGSDSDDDSGSDSAEDDEDEDDADEDAGDLLAQDDLVPSSETDFPGDTAL
ncbi:MAG: hypothetical protein ABIQ44_15975 [Chloroflexia bacterium]